MQAIVIRTFSSADAAAVMDLQRAYTDIYPGAPVIPAEMYLSPAFHGGQDVFCAYDGESLLAYAPLYVQLIEAGPADLPHVAWVEMKSSLSLLDSQMVKDALLERLMGRARQLVADAAGGSGRPIRMTFEYRASEKPAAAYVQSKGFAYVESVFLMRRDLTMPLPAGEGTIRDGAAAARLALALRRWKMPAVEDQRAYITARNECFPEAPITLESWQYYMLSPQWAAGVMIAGFDGAELAGAVNVYWDEAENRHAERPAGYTEDIFVRAPYRGRGLARAMIVDGMRYLKEHGLREARLNVRAVNETALTLYQRLGYQVSQESRFYAKTIEM